MNIMCLIKKKRFLIKWLSLWSSIFFFEYPFCQKPECTYVVIKQKYVIKNNKKLKLNQDYPRQAGYINKEQIEKMSKNTIRPISAWRGSYLLSENKEQKVINPAREFANALRLTLGGAGH